jgi:hypothetical protein
VPLREIGMRPEIAQASTRWRHHCTNPWREDVGMDEPFQRGELVTLRDVDPAPLGRILMVTPAGDQAEVAWHKRTGPADEVTLESTVSLRRVHESEMDPDPE